MVNRYSWHKLGAKGVCGLAERLNAYFWMILVAQRGTITQTPLCAKFVPRISVDHWVRGVWADYYNSWCLCPVIVTPFRLQEILNDVGVPMIVFCKSSEDTKLIRK